MGRLNELGYLTVKGDVGVYDDAVSVTGIWDGARASAGTQVRVIGTRGASERLDVHALPQRFFVDPGDRLRLSAVALNGLGELVAGTELRWSMEDARAGTVGGNGDFVAGPVPGVYTEAVKVEAVIPGERGFVRAVDFASVVVREEQAPGRLDAIYVSPARVKLAPGSRIPLIARAVDESGRPPENVTVAWEVLEQGAGDVNALGSFTVGSAPGIYPEALRVTANQQIGEEPIIKTRTIEVVITGTLSTASVAPAVAVVAPGRTIHFSLTALDENGITLPGLVVIWSVSDEKVGVIDAFGNFTAGDFPGSYQDAIRAEVVQALPDLN